MSGQICRLTLQLARQILKLNSFMYHGKFRPNNYPKKSSKNVWLKQSHNYAAHKAIETNRAQKQQKSLGY